MKGLVAKKKISDEKARPNRKLPKLWILNVPAIKFSFNVEYFNPFVANAPFLYPLKTSENLIVFWCSQGIEKECIGNKSVSQLLLTSDFRRRHYHLCHCKVISMIFKNSKMTNSLLNLIFAWKIISIPLEKIVHLGQILSSRANDDPYGRLFITCLYWV